MKKICAAIAAIIMISNFSVYAEKSLSIEQAKTLAVENSNLIKVADLKIESDEIEAREALAEKNRTKNTARLGVTSVVETTLLRRGYYSDAAAAKFELSKLEKVKTVDMMEIGAVREYYSLLNAYEMLRIKNESLEIAKENTRAVNTKYDLGKVSKFEKESADFLVSQLELEVDSAKRGLEYAKLSFNSALGLDPSEEVTLTDSLTVTAPEQTDLEQCVKTALENNIEVIGAKYALSLAEKKAECYAAFSTKGTYYYKLREYDIEKAKSELENKKKEIALSVKKSYFDYLDSYNTALSADIAVSKAELMHGLAKSKFDNGLGTNLDVVKAQNDLDAAKLQRSGAHTAYYLAKLLFESSLNV